MTPATHLPLHRRATLGRYAEVPPVEEPAPHWRPYWPSVAIWIVLPLVSWWLVLVLTKALVEAALAAGAASPGAW